MQERKENRAHSLYNIVLNKGIEVFEDERLLNRIKFYFYYKVWEKIIEEEDVDKIIQSLLNIIKHKYIVQQDKEGLKELGFNIIQIDELINSYNQWKVTFINSLLIKYKEEIEDIKKELEVWFKSIEVNEEGTYYKIDGKPFIDDIIESKTGNKTYIRVKDYIFTSYFFKFITLKHEYLNKTNLRMIKKALNWWRNDRINILLPRLERVVGKLKARKLLKKGHSYSIKGDFYADSSLYSYLNTNRHNSPFFVNTDNLKIVSRKIGLKLKKELRKFYYQEYKKDISYLFTDSTLDSNINYKLLFKYNIFIKA